MTNSPKAGSFQLMKSINRTLILNTIRKENLISRAEIAKKTKLTPPTVTNLVNELLEANLVKESEMGISKGGRKPILLSINATGFYVIGVDVGVQKLRVVMTDLSANIIEEIVVPLLNGITKEELIQVIKENIHSVINISKINRVKIIGVGVGMHGIVDYKKGIAIYAPNLHLKNIALKEELEKEFQLPVKVENDAKALALGENWFGYGLDVDHMVCINVGIGVGAGIIFKDRLFHGLNGIAGEIGHTLVDINGPICACGNYGCLQTLCAGEAIRNYAIDEIDLGRETVIMDLVKNDISKIEAKTIHDAAKCGDELAVEILEKSGRFLGIGIANLINSLNPQLVVLSGGISKAENFILEPVKNEVQKRVLTDEAKKTPILISNLGDRGTVIGAVTLVLSELFIPENVSH
ncbi:MAG: ROK family protein [Anaerobacillus sp.]|uniref:ROK family transcriptional regulator n=1 Tax=Anaerobacillus sp. TaxID=1872506 RepID=UPI003919A316